jgi:hypothetical protein
MTARPYTKGWRPEWKGEWGPLRDGHSRLGRLAKTIEREILDELPADLSPLLRRRVKAVAAAGALAEMARQTFGVDPKVTRRTVTVAERHFAAELARLRDTTPGIPDTPEDAFASLVRGNGARPKGDRP